MNIKLLDSNRNIIDTIEEAGDAGQCTIDCPACGAADLRVQGNGRRIAEDDRAYEATAFSVCCGAMVGTIRAETDTLFGLREDEAVMKHGSVRIYG